MVGRQGLEAAAQVAGCVLGMVGVPCIEYGIVGKIRAALPRYVIAALLYGLVLAAFLALLSGFQPTDVRPAGLDVSDVIGLLVLLGATGILFSYALAYATPHLEAAATLRHLASAIGVGGVLVGLCAFVFLMSGHAAKAPSAASAGLVVAVCFVSAGFAFIVVPLIAPPSGGRTIEEVGSCVLLLGLTLAALPRILDALYIAIH